MKKATAAITTALFCAIIVFFVVSGIIIPDSDFSENENRFLTTEVEMSFESIVSGKFTSTAEKYIDDQFFLRNELISFKTLTQQMMLNKDIGGVYLGKEKYLFEKIRDGDFDNAQTKSNVETVNAFMARHSNITVSLLLSPNAALVLKDKLPPYAPYFNQSSEIDNIKASIDCGFIDVREVLNEKSSEYIFYKTDHHWTTLGAFYAYQALRNAKGLSSVDIDDYDVKLMTTAFRGALYSKALNLNSADDSIYIFEPKHRENYSVEYNYGKEVTSSVYDLNKLNTKDKYQLFLGGNPPEVKIKTDNADGKNLLVFKDSFANSFIPFLIGDYKNICVIDLRYFNQDVNAYILENDIDEIMFLYNIVNFSSDKSFEKLIK
ncbi:MAG: DHHW family protein [Clostridia bacterium]